MRIRLLPSACSESASSHQLLTSILVNDTVAIDAGSLGFFATLAEQRKVRHLFISHSHIDHIASLPIFLENVYTPDDESVTVWGSDTVLETLQRDLFNDRIWPDFIRLSRECPPFLRLERLEEGKTVEIDGVRLTPVSVDHVVPTFGFLVEEPGAAVVIVSDTGPTQGIWDRANRLPNLQAVFLDASFQDSYSGLAQVSEHLTPSLFAAETAKLQQDARFFAIHIKATQYSQVVKELSSLGLPRLEVAAPGKEYRFGSE